MIRLVDLQEGGVGDASSSSTSSDSSPEERDVDRQNEAWSRSWTRGPSDRQNNNKRNSMEGSFRVLRPTSSVHRSSSFGVNTSPTTVAGSRGVSNLSDIKLMFLKDDNQVFSNDDLFHSSPFVPHQPGPPSQASSSDRRSTRSHRSHEEKMLARRQKLRNIELLDESSLDLLSSSSSDSSSQSSTSESLNANHIPLEEDDTSSMITNCNYNDNRTTRKDVPVKPSDAMLLSVICDFSSDESSLSELTNCKPPSLLERINNLSSSESGSLERKKKKKPNHRPIPHYRLPTIAQSSKTVSPGPQNQWKPLTPPVRKKASTVISKEFRRKKTWISSMATSFPNSIARKSNSTSDINSFLDLTKPPSLLDIISSAINSLSRSKSRGSSNNSLNSVTSDIFDIEPPVQDVESEAVNVAASAFAEGINQLTKSFDREIMAESVNNSGNETYPVDNPIVVKKSEEKWTTCCNEKERHNIAQQQLELDIISQKSQEDIMENVKFKVESRFSDSDDGGKSNGGTGDDISDSKSDFGVDDLPTDNGLDYTLIGSTDSVAEDAGCRTLVEEDEDEEDPDKQTSSDACYRSAQDHRSSSSSVYTDAVADDPFKESPQRDFSNPEDYQRYVMTENAKFLAHTVAEMARCTGNVSTSATPSTEDFVSVVSSFDIMDVNDLSAVESDDGEDPPEDDDSRATYNVDERRKRQEKKRQQRKNSNHDTTYPLESPQVLTPSSSSSSGQYYTANSRFPTPSDTTTYAIEDNKQPPPCAPIKQRQQPAVKIRETRTSALRRALKTRSLEVEGTMLGSISGMGSSITGLGSSITASLITPSPSLDSQVLLRRRLPPTRKPPRPSSQIITSSTVGTMNYSVKTSATKATRPLSIPVSHSLNTFRPLSSSGETSTASRTSTPSTTSTSRMTTSTSVSNFRHRNITSNTNNLMNKSMRLASSTVSRKREEDKPTPFPCFIPRL